MCVPFRARLHRASASTLRQHYDDASDIVLIVNNGFTPKWVATLFWSGSIVFNQSSIASIITVLTLMLSVHGPLNGVINLSYVTIYFGSLVTVFLFFGRSVHQKCQHGMRMLQSTRCMIRTVSSNRSQLPMFLASPTITLLCNK